MIEKRRIVVDADVLMMASDMSPAINCVNCVRFLRKILDICHMIVAGGKISQEYLDHNTVYSRIWLSDMASQEKVKNYAFSTSLENMSNEIKSLDIFSPEEIPNIEKDLHLIQAALSTDGIVVSVDGKARRKFAIVSRSEFTLAAEIGDIVWINPTNEGENLMQWLESGAPKDNARMLKNYPL
ncbi:MAG: hypothetical protein HQ591_06235 [candidate division Zixibacteria bacterium]|nr:hypothetical protein [Candidatus Tariuqbacter arcticus]